MKITPVILSGGSGTRLWPVSRELRPKQFIDFFGPTSLFGQAALRVKNKNFHEVIVVCNEEHRFTAAEELQKLNIKPQEIILEPTARNTAPAIAVAALAVIKENPENDLMLVMPSDHLIADVEEFLKTVNLAKKAALKDYIVTFGVKVTKAETGYGYIKKSKKLAGINQVFAAAEFIEKPEKKIAERLALSPNHLWNSGIFMFKASVYLQALREFSNEIFVNSVNAYHKAKVDLDFLRLRKSDFEKCANISIDYAILEKTKKLAVAELASPWSDVGSWDAVASLAKKDKNHNSVNGEVFALDCKNCYINSRGKLLAAIGLSNLIIVAVKDAILIADKSKAQDVKKMFEILKEHHREECHSHNKVLRPWGSFEVIEIDKKFKVKKITIKPQAAISLQMHTHRSEHWIITKGTAHVTCDKEEFTLKENESTYIPLGKKHRLENRGKIPLEIIEVQTGDYLKEDDIIRFSDIYGR